jgi:hypothetical protein
VYNLAYYCKKPPRQSKKGKKLILSCKNILYDQYNRFDEALNFFLPKIPGLPGAARYLFVISQQQFYYNEEQYDQH